MTKIKNYKGEVFASSDKTLQAKEQLLKNIEMSIVPHYQENPDNGKDYKKPRNSRTRKTTASLDQTKDDILEIIEYAFFLLSKRSSEAKNAIRQTNRKN